MRSRKYEFVVAARVDLLWLAQPPLHMMNADSVWIPDGQDWGGFNDRWPLSAKRSVSVVQQGSPCWDHIEPLLGSNKESLQNPDLGSKRSGGPFSLTIKTW